MITYSERRFGTNRQQSLPRRPRCYVLGSAYTGSCESEFKTFECATGLVRLHSSATRRHDTIDQREHPMSLFEDTNPRSLKDLLAEVHSRTMVLPDFQRDFVWEPGATQELIVSIANNYPAGSLLRVRDAKRVFAAREFEGASSLAGQKHTFLVLD